VTGFAVGSAADNGEELLLGAAIGHGVGAVGGLISAGEVAPSIARVRFLDLGGLSGGLVGAGVYLIAAGDNNVNGRAISAVTAAGIGTGLGLSWYLTRNMKPNHLSPREESPVTSLRTQITPTVGGAQLSLGGQW
jgi:hypothetical protein